MPILVREAVCAGCGVGIGGSAPRFVALDRSGEPLQFCDRSCYEGWLERPTVGKQGEGRKRKPGRTN